MDVLPTEFRLFRRGVNASTKGDVVFDDAAAKLVMAAYQAHAVRLMIDLEHLSLEGPADMDTDARGWFSLAERDGELWAVEVKWTDDGARRLSTRAQVYPSPAFEVDDESRVTRVLNVALTSMPATHGATQLVAASDRGSRRSRRQHGVRTMSDGSTSEKLAALYVAFGLEPTAPLADLFAEMSALMAAAKGEPEPTSETPAEMSADEEEPAALADAPTDEDEEKAMARALRALTGRKPASEAIDDVRTWRDAYMALASDREKVARDRVALERTERHELVKTLVKHGLETPATAWADLDGKRIAEPLASMKLGALRERVRMLTAGRPVPKDISAPASSDVTVDGYTLSAREHDMCKTRKLDPEKYAATRAGIMARSASARKAG